MKFRVPGIALQPSFDLLLRLRPIPIIEHFFRGQRVIGITQGFIQLECFLSGFLAPDEKVSYGRPVGVTLGPDGALLVADDVGDVIWRVTGV